MIFLRWVTGTSLWPKTYLNDKQPSPGRLTRSVRRAGGFVQKGFYRNLGFPVPGHIPTPSLWAIAGKRLSRIAANCSAATTLTLPFELRNRGL